MVVHNWNCKIASIIFLSTKYAVLVCVADKCNYIFITVMYYEYYLQTLNIFKKAINRYKHSDLKTTTTYMKYIFLTIIVSDKPLFIMMKSI